MGTAGLLTLSAPLMDSTGPIPMMDGSHPERDHDTSLANGLSPCSLTASSLTITRDPAPSQMPEAFAAVTSLMRDTARYQGWAIKSSEIPLYRYRKGGKNTPFLLEDRGELGQLGSIRDPGVLIGSHKLDALLTLDLHRCRLTCQDTQGA